MSIINSQPRIGAAGQSTGFKIERSLRFNSADSAYLNRTPGSAGNRRTWTWSGWIKRGLVDTNYRSFFSNGNAVDSVMFWNDTSLAVRNFNGTSYDVRTTQLFRDPSAWYHLVIAMDTTQATASNRIKIYVNGVQVTAFALATYPSQNYDTGFNTTTVQYLGYNEYNYFDGYMTEVNFLDGYTPTTTTRTVGGVTETVLTQFGEFDTDTGVWKPKAYSGSYGTNGFYLKFADNSGTTSTTLGKDSSGNGNNWTPNNFSVTAGAGNDSLVDTPTPYGTDTGAGGEVRGNYATLNPTIPPLTSQATTVISNGNLDFSVTQQNGSFGAAFSTIGVSSGKWYFEYLATNIRTSTYVGFFNSGNFAGYNGGTTGIGAPSDAYARAYSGYIINNNGVLVSGLSTFTDGDIVMCAVDFDAGKMWFGVNGTWDSSGNPGAGTNQTASFTPGGKTYVFAVSGYANTGVGVVNGTANFGQRPFAYTAPSGFKALCTQNLPTPEIGAIASKQAGKYFNTIIWTGTDTTASRSFTGVGFQPDFVWAKIRSNTGFEHLLYDAVRGAGNDKELSSNSTGAEGYLNTDAQGYLSSFNSDGFSSTVGTIQNEWFNRTGYTYVAWNWKANGAGSSNTSGTITSTVSANTTAGFSIVTYTAAGANSTVGHGLGVAPSIIIIKRRDSTGGWGTYHSAVGNTKYLILNGTDAATTDSTYWNNTSPTSTVFSLGSIWPNTATYVAYCFSEIAGYSKFGSYTGNGSTDGPFVFTGFRPAWVLVKPSSTTGDWLLYDNKRNSYNVVNNILYPNTSGAEATSGGGATLDFVSNGFKLRGAGTGFNDSGTTFVYACFAENPFKYSLAR